MDEVVGIFAQRMDEELRSMRLTRADLARRVSALSGTTLDPSAITRVINGERGVRLEEAVRIAEVLGVPLSSLLQARADDREDEIVRERMNLAKHLAQLAKASDLAAEARSGVDASFQRIRELESRI